MVHQSMHGRFSATRFNDEKIKKVVVFGSKKNEKRIISFFGFVAKIQQAIRNKESSFIYFSNYRIFAFLNLLQQNGFVQAFYILPVHAQKRLGLSFSSEFSGRVLIVYLKPVDNWGLALNTIRLFSLPSRSLYITYRALRNYSVKLGTTSMYVLNTSKGLLTHTQALQHRIGGQLVCELN